MNRRLFVWPALAVLVALGLEVRERVRHPSSVAVEAAFETEPVPHRGDAADDPALFLPEQGGGALLVGTDKKGALLVYDFQGREVFRVEGDRYNNVDLRQDAAWGQGRIALVAATNKTSDTVDLFALEPDPPRLARLEVACAPAIDPEGVCLYRPAGGEALFVFTIGDAKHGSGALLEQWRVEPSGARRVRSLAFEGTCEGLAADDALGWVFVAEEDRGVWRLAAAPDARDDRVLVAEAGLVFAPLRHDVEGLAVFARPGGAGFLVASSQGSDDFVVFDRAPPHALRGRFHVVAEGGRDRVTHTDGIEATATPLPPRFPKGIFVCQDDDNGDANQNFKVVSWEAIARALELEDE